MERGEHESKHTVYEWPQVTIRDTRAAHRKHTLSATETGLHSHLDRAGESPRSPDMGLRRSPRTQGPTG